MTLKIVLLLLGGASIVGIAIGYYLRLIISLGKKGSVELELKQIQLDAQKREKGIIDEATAKAEKILTEAREEVKEKEEKNKKTEDRLIKKEEFLDNRQIEIDKEVEIIKDRVAEIKKIREEAEKLAEEKEIALQKVASLTKEQAKEEIIKKVENQYETDILARIQK